MQVRGYYNGLDSTSLLKLAKDVGYIMLEKDKKKNLRKEPQKLKPRLRKKLKKD
jgi:hypothetical protein